MGVSRGNSPEGSSTVSYALEMALVSRNALVSSSSAATWKYVKTTWPSRIFGHSVRMGSFTFMILSARAHTSSGVSTISAPAFSLKSSVEPLPSPALVSMIRSCPAFFSISAPAGVRATRSSSGLISFGTPMSI